MAGLGTLIRLILRRDRVKLPVWIVAIVASLLSMVPLLKETYGMGGELETMYQTFGANPAGLFLTGPMDSPTMAAFMTLETLLWWGLAIAFMNVLLVVRHTRQNEEMGAQELLLSGHVHRTTNLVAVLLVAVATNTVLAVSIGAGMAAVGAGEWGAESAWLYGVAFGVFGVVWAAIAALVVQLFENTRSATGMLASLIGVAFVVRGVGDFMGTKNADGLLEPAWVSSLSPFGWLQATRPLTFPDWWPLLIPLACAVVMIPVAMALQARRDVGAGLLPSRRGRAQATSFLQTPLGLTWYLQKNIFIGWLCAIVVMVLTIGVLVPEMSHIYESSESLKQMIEAMGGSGQMIPTFLSAMLSIIVLMVAAYVVQGLGRLRGEEFSGHLENLLALGISRATWLALHTGVVLVGGLVMLVLTGWLLALSVNLGTDFAIDTGSYILAAVSYWPLLLLFAGIYVLLFGLLPRAAGLVTWVYFGIVLFLSWLAPLLQLDQWVMSISPLEYIAAAPAEDIELMPLVYSSAVALGLAVVGFAAWRNRNLLER
ncbi:MAG: hypothetical protein WAS27_00715 [Candidatus Saccharimonadales bacterium]